ncbi:hypothetical protein [Dietzia sp. UBA5065]|uniref:hypothetical protein n=1 Tax=Dietzia sp. UBA5065 TaxID=1946422 RepID=UPI0025C6A924|nr:hypothetical protein [Dietzia sp. UBA5065]HMT48802.1 hypothetical protein [Dietzia sp.]
MPLSAPAPLSRRRFVGLTAGVGGLVAAGGCTPPRAADEPDPLQQLADAAERDARELAAADATHGEDVARLRRIADARRTQAERLSAEIRRLAPEGTAEGTAETGPPPVCPPIGQVRARMRDDARRAGEVAESSRGYRSELAASVSAACTAALEVVLA